MFIVNKFLKCLNFSEPSKPLNLTVYDINSNTIYLSWNEPEECNGAIEGYRIYFLYVKYNYTDVRTAKGNSPHMKYNLTGLSKYSFNTLLVFYSSNVNAVKIISNKGVT